MYPLGVTIAIPNWNHELLLPQSILSGLRAVALLEEESIPGEVLVIDDYSRDGSRALLRQLEPLYFASGLRVAMLPANGGLAAARNFALEHGRYRYVAFLDADNEILPENLGCFVRTLRATGAAAAYGNLLVRSLVTSFSEVVISNESFQPRIFDLNYIDACALFDRVQLLDVGGYDASCAAHEDCELWLHLACEGRRVLFVPAVFAYYYLLPSSMLDLYRNSSSGTSSPVHARLQRIFNQVGARSRLPSNTERLRYHPEIGYL